MTQTPFRFLICGLLLSSVTLCLGQGEESTSQLLNIAARALVQRGDQVCIAGFVVQNTAAIVPTGAPNNAPEGGEPAPPPRRFMIRGIGPSLQVGGTPVVGRLANPVIELYNQAGAIIASNDNWPSHQEAEIQTSGLAPSDPSEAAIIVELPEGFYTVVMRGAGETTGIGLVEVYDRGEPSVLELANLSARALIGASDNDPLIGGLITGGTNPLRVMLRAIGPTLTPLGVPGALQDPVLTLYDSNGSVVETNNDWREAGNRDEVQASGLAPGGEREAAILFSPAAGNYTVVVRGADGTVGIGLVEAYRLSSSGPAPL